AGVPDTGDARIFVTRAVILLRLNDTTGAVRDARAALEIEPANAEAAVVLAAERLGRGDAEGALLILDREPVARLNDLGVQLFKIKVLEHMGNSAQVEAVLLKLIENHPQQTVFRRQLVKYYVDQKRFEDAESNLRALSAASPADVDAGLDIVRFLQTTKGPDAARHELLNLINAGGEVFPYQIALAEFDLGQGNMADSIKLLEKLAADTRLKKENI